MSAAVERRHWHFTGSVQGVGFRYRAQYAAQLLDLTGWVENNWDGTVDLEAQGSAAQLDRLVPTITGTSHWIHIETFTCKSIPPDPAECNLVRRTEKGRLRRRGWGLRWEKAQKGGKGTNLRGFFED